MLKPITKPLNYSVQIRVILHLPPIHVELEDCASISEFPGECKIVFSFKFMQTEAVLTMLKFESLES